MKRIICIIALLLFSGAGFAGDQHYHVTVGGLVCPFCVYGVEKKLKNLDGVIEISSNLEKGEFFLRLENGLTLSEDAVRELVTAAGFTLLGFEEVDDED